MIGRIWGCRAIHIFLEYTQKNTLHFIDSLSLIHFNEFSFKLFYSFRNNPGSMISVCLMIDIYCLWLTVFAVDITNPHYR